MHVLENFINFRLFLLSYFCNKSYYFLCYRNDEASVFADDVTVAWAAMFSAINETDVPASVLQDEVFEEIWRLIFQSKSEAIIQATKSFHESVPASHVPKALT